MAFRKDFGSGRGGGFNRGGGFRRFGGPREMHKIKCTACGKDAEVPFKPKEGLPVYCRDCFMKNKGSSGMRSNKPAPQEEEFEEETSGSEDTEEEY